MFLTKYDLMVCLGGSLIDCLDHSLEPETVLKLMYQATQAVKHMHLQSVPITHLDIKVNMNYGCLTLRTYICMVSIRCRSKIFLSALMVC